MTSILNPFRRMFKPIQPIKEGIYHYQAPPDDPRNYRMHLRLEADGDGVLIINASTVLHLNQTAAEYAYHLVHNTPVDQAAEQVAKRYLVSKDQAKQDYINLNERIQVLIETPDLDPITFLDFDRQRPFTGRITAPYRLDCALTYRLPEDSPDDAAPGERVERELSTDEWKRILDKAWNAGIPHVVFTGGEPTLREDLVDLIDYAENLGQISGLLSDGLRFSDRDYLKSLLDTGLDHLMIVLQPESPVAWQALENALVDDLFVAVHLTITAENKANIPALLEKLAAAGVHEISLSASDEEFSADLEAAREQAAALELDLVWNLPVPYSAMNPVELELIDIPQPEGAGRAWMYVEPDGDVLPTQDGKPVLGNFLNDSWEQIWRDVNLP
jgi:organic radical activating enzyme